MLQIENKSFASDALEDAMRLAQIKSLNSFTFSDCLQYLNYAWRDIYDRMAMIDDGYYGINVQITQKLTKLPPFVKNSVQIYEAQSPVDSNRLLYRTSGPSDMVAPRTYKISGTDLYVPDVERGRKIWLYYVPMCKQVFFTHHNRDPKILEEGDIDLQRNNVYNLYKVKVTVSDTEAVGGEAEIDITDTSEPLYKVDEDGNVVRYVKKVELVHRVKPTVTEDLSENIFVESEDELDGQWYVTFISADYPYIFVSYVHSITGEHKSGFFDAEGNWNEYNPFNFIGRSSDVEYISCSWNDKTGLGVVVRDYNDTYSVVEQVDGKSTTVKKAKIKELGWTPDSVLDYPIPEMYRYLVARLADKFSALNESNVMGVQKELIESRFAFEAFLERDKSSFKRMVNVNLPTIDDWL